MLPDIWKNKEKVVTLRGENNNEEKNMNTEQTLLQLHIKPSKPIEINDFTTSLNAVSNLFSSFVQKNGSTEELSQARLCVERIEEGSIVIYLAELVSSTLIPFVENANIIIEFASFVKRTCEYYIHGKGEKEELSISDCSDFNNMLSLVAGDNKGEMSIGAVSKGDGNKIFVGCTFNYFDCNTGQNQLKKEMERLKKLSPISKKYLRQLMTIYQLRSDMENNSGNKAVIEGISNKKVALLFETDDLKERILRSDCNPVKRAFFVDVEVQTINDKIAAYKVLNLHETIELD